MKRFEYKQYKKNIALKTLLVVAILSAPLGFIGYNLRMMDAAASFTFEHEPDPASFFSLNETELSAAVDELAVLYAKYHMPLNQNVALLFGNDPGEGGIKDSYANISGYIHSDNHALWTGIDYVGWVYQYLAAQQEEDSVREEFALNVLLNLTTGMAKLMKVPNGGLGPDYGGVLARGYAPPDAQEIWPEIFEDKFKHANGTGQYSDWRYRGYTSNDEFAGYYLFLAIATRYLRHIEYIEEKVSLIVDQICFNMLADNFQAIHTTGATTGADQNPLMFHGGFWIPLLLKLGAIYHPEKYERLYYHHVANEMIYLSNQEGSRTTVLGSYYPYNFEICIILGFLLIEDPGTTIWQHYFQGYLDTHWKFTRHHRNAWFNAIFLLILHENGLMDTNLGENLDIISLDVQDQLQRLYNQHYPMYRRPTIELPEEYRVLSPEEILSELGIGEELKDVLGMGNHQYTNKPMTAEYIRPRRWFWNRNPFHVIEHQGNIRHMEAGSSLFVPYWLLRYLGEIQGGELQL